MPNKTLFERLLVGELPCHKVYEDERCFAILDIEPRAPGHTLVIPKEPKRTLGELSDASAAALGVALAKVARAVAQATGVPDYNVLQNNGALAGQEVPHVHFHVVPKPSEDAGLRVANNKLEQQRAAERSEGAQRWSKHEMATQIVRCLSDG